MRKRSKVSSQRSTIISLLRKYFLFFFACLLLNITNAQTVSATLDRDKILLGEQVTLQFTVTKIDEGLAFISTWPKFKDTVNHAEIIKQNPIDSINVNGTYTYRQNITLTSFDSGRWQLGPFNFVIRDRATGKQTQLNAPLLYLTVLPVDVASMQQYHPIKDIIDVDAPFNWKPFIIAAIALAVAIIIFLIIKNRKKKIAEIPTVAIKGTPLERAMEKLYALKNERLTNDDEIKKFHTTIDDVTRKYFEEMMRVKAMQLTISELFSRINVYLQDAELRKKFRQVFELNASVKFAKYMPADKESKSTLNEIIKDIHEVDDYINRAKTDADRMVSKY